MADLEELRGEPGVRRGFPPACPVEQVTCRSGKTVKVIQDVHPVLHFPGAGLAEQGSTISGLLVHARDHAVTLTRVTLAGLIFATDAIPTQNSSPHSSPDRPSSRE